MFPLLRPHIFLRRRRRLLLLLLECFLECFLITLFTILLPPFVLQLVLCSDEFYNLFKYVESPLFDLASDAFNTLKDLLTRHKRLVSEFLELNYERVRQIIFSRGATIRLELCGIEFFVKQTLRQSFCSFQVFTHYQALLTSENYVTRRQSLKLLGELLLDRSNYNVMSRYISSSENLKLMMNLLKDKSRNIRIEAFHVFKVTAGKFAAADSFCFCTVASFEVAPRVNPACLLLWIL